MRGIRAAVGILLLLSPAALAGDIFGTIKEGKDAVPEKTKIQIKIDGETVDGEVKKDGRYRIHVKKKGKATLTLRYKDQAPSIEVHSYDQEARFDLLVERQQNGTYTLKRK